jgi:hypothetical protein
MPIAGTSYREFNSRLRAWFAALAQLAPLSVPGLFFASSQSHGAPARMVTMPFALRMPRRQKVQTASKSICVTRSGISKAQLIRVDEVRRLKAQ